MSYYTGIGDAYCEAFPVGDGTFRLKGRGTYGMRDKIKSLGGRWEPKGRYWIVQESALSSIAHQRLYRARTEGYCHELDDTEHWVNREDIKSGWVNTFCGRCDSQSRAKILEILPDAGPT